MLPELHRQCYEEFRRKLSNLVEIMKQFELDFTSLGRASQKVQLFFRDQVSALALDELTGRAAQRSHAYRVEMHKQLRLLAVDIMFLQAAKQSATVQQRVVAVRDRLTTLVGYCDALLTESAPDQPE